MKYLSAFFDLQFLCLYENQHRAKHTFELLYYTLDRLKNVNYYWKEMYESLKFNCRFTIIYNGLCPYLYLYNQ